MAHLSPTEVRRILDAHDTGREADLLALTGSQTIEGARWLVGVLRKQWEGRLRSESVVAPKGRPQMGKASRKRRNRPPAPVPPQGDPQSYRRVSRCGWVVGGGWAA